MIPPPKEKIIIIDRVFKISSIYLYFEKCYTL